MMLSDACNTAKKALVSVFKKATGMARLETKLTDRELIEDALHSGHPDYGSGAGIFNATGTPAFLGFFVVAAFSAPIIKTYGLPAFLATWATAITIPSIVSGQIYATYKCFQQNRLDAQNAANTPKP